MSPKRRLPVLNAPDGEESPISRPSWQWVGLGTLAIFVVWIPLAWVAVWIQQRSPVIDATPIQLLGRVLLFVAGLAVAAFAAGFLLGRWGGRGIGVREAAVAGLVAALVAVAMTCATAGVAAGLWAAAPTLVFAVVPAALAGRWGVRRRVRLGIAG